MSVSQNTVNWVLVHLVNAPKGTKMLLCSTEVAVKETTLGTYSRENIMYEAMVMTEVCRGHPNLVHALHRSI